MASPELTIDKEFAGIIPASAADEREQLRANLLADGCRDPIIVWANHDDIILDGHTRYALCRELKIDYKIRAIRMDDRDACVAWIAANQLGRRNLTPEQKSYLRGKEYLATKKPVGAPEDNRNNSQCGKSCHFNFTAENMGKTHNVSPRTVRNDADFAAAVDDLEKAVGGDTKADILSGNSPLPKAAVARAASLKSKAAKKKAVKTGELPPEKPAKPGAQKKDPRLWREIEAALGRSLRMGDDLNRQSPHGNLHRQFIRSIKEAMATLASWKEAAQ